MKNNYPVRNNEKRNSKNFNGYYDYEKEFDFDELDTSIKEAWFESIENDNYDMDDLDFRYSAL